ncbi:MAG TPA: glycosyltransferase [Mycobacteriales bacterium]|nr:glycosyltransferase [Mycobacteriales bacterium]
MSVGSPAAQVAVVVATHRRAPLLPRLAAAMAAQEDAPGFEVVVVDDASADGTADVLHELARESAAPLVPVVRDVNGGPAAARNSGWRASRAELVLFTDDDCVPEPGWVAAMVAALQQADVVQGVTIPDPEQAGRAGPFSRTIDAPAPDDLFRTCNVAYRREVLERIGGFDESFRVCEDTDLAWRARSGGARTAFAPDAVVHHDVRPSSLRAQLVDARRWADIPHVVRRHPGVRELIHSRHFWRATHGPALAAAAGLAVAVAGGRRGRLLAPALLAPYLKLRLVDQPLPHVRRRQRLLLLPAAFAVDITEVITLAAGSARHRCLVL